MANSRELYTTTLFSDANLKAYYRLEGNFTDSSASGFNGTGSTSPTSVPSGGKFGGAYDWDGAANAVTATFTSLTPFSSAWTANLWIEPDTLGEGGVGDYSSVFNFGGKSVLQFDSESGSDMKIKFVQSFSGTDGAWKTDGFVIPKNTYTMITVVYSGTATTNDATIYVNGAVTPTTESSTPTGTVETSTGLVLGNNSGSGIRAYDGAMDDIAFFDRALTSVEILSLYDFTSSFFMMF